jgi:hypothetical protein
MSSWKYLAQSKLILSEISCRFDYYLDFKESWTQTGEMDGVSRGSHW